MQPSKVQLPDDGVRQVKTAIVQLAEEIARKSNEPLSLDEIKGKYQLEFPFSVRKVCNVPNPYSPVWPVGRVVTIVGYYSEGDYLTGDDIYTLGNLRQWVLV